MMCHATAPDTRLLILDRVIHDMRMHEGLRPLLSDLEAARDEMMAMIRRETIVCPTCNTWIEP